MKEPLRLLSDTDTPAAMLRALSAAKRTPPLPPAVRASMLEVAGRLAVTSVAASAAVTAPTASVVLQTSAAKVAAKALLVVAGLGSAGGLAYVAEPLVVGAVQGQRPISTVANGQVARAPRVAATQETKPTSVIAVAPADEARWTKAPTGIVPRPKVTAELEESTIAAEARLLERARGHLASDPALALEETNLHQARFGTGQMSAERELIAVEALLRLGRRVQAERRAEPRLQLDPTGLYAKRLRQLLEEF